MILGGSNTGVSLAINAVVKEEGSLLRHRRRRRSLTGRTARPTRSITLHTVALANGTAKTILKQGGNSWFFLTADYAFGTHCRRRDQCGDRERRHCGRIGAGAARNVRLRSYLLQAQSSGAQVLGLANAAPTSQLVKPPMSSASARR